MQSLSLSLFHSLTLSFSQIFSVLQSKVSLFFCKSLTFSPSQIIQVSESSLFTSLSISQGLSRIFLGAISLSLSPNFPKLSGQVSVLPFPSPFYLFLSLSLARLLCFLFLSSTFFPSSFLFSNFLKQPDQLEIYGLGSARSWANADFLMEEKETLSRCSLTRLCTPGAHFHLYICLGS